MIRSVAFIVSILLFGISLSTGHAQVTISPTTVFLDSNSKVGSFFVSNPSNSAVEVRLSFEFAYPDTDSDGRIFLNYDDSEAEERFSLGPHLRAFPTTFILDPNQRQTIRLIGRLPQTTDPGTYWTRMRISSSQLTPPIGEAVEGQVAAQVTFQIDQVTAVLVHHGNVDTGVTIHSAVAQIDAERDRLQILTDVERTGNAPFIGSVTTTILGPNGQELDTRRSSTSVYFRNLQRVEFDLSELSVGTYTAVTTFETSRNDISTRNLIQASSVTERVTFSIE